MMQHQSYAAVKKAKINLAPAKKAKTNDVL